MQLYLLNEQDKTRQLDWLFKNENHSLKSDVLMLDVFVKVVIKNLYCLF